MPDRKEINKRGYLKEDFRLFHLKDSRAQKVDYHYHAFDKLILLLGGKVTYVVEGVTYFLQPWDLLLVGHDLIHRPIIDPAEPYERVVIWLGREWLERRSDPGEALDTCFDTTRERGFHLLRFDAERRLHYMQRIQQLEEALRGEGYDGQNGQPCFVTEVYPSGTVRVMGSSYYQISEEDLLALVQECLSQQEESGLLTDYHLRYLRYDGALSIRIAFTDSTLEQSALRAMAGTLLLIALAALVVLLGCSYLLSGVAARPVERAWQEQQRFLSDASHELKTPLTVILSSADLLAESAPAEEQTYVENIRAESRRMKKLVEEMLTLFRAESVRRETAFSEVDLSDVVTDAALRFEPVVFESGRRLLYTIDEGLQVSGDRDALERLTGILLDHAVKYAPQGTDIRLTLTHQDRTACLTVENGGDPIPPEVAAHLFDRFYRADSSRTGTGFGLGLAIARAIAQNHKGNITCRSQEGVNRFSVTLPVLRQKEAQ